MELASIYNQFHKTLLGFIKSKVTNHEDAEDIVQNVFVKVAGSIDNLNRKEKLHSWIYTIARNSIIDYYRSNANKKDLVIEGNIDESFTNEEYIDTTNGLECCLVDMVNQLPEEYRDIIVDVEMKGIKQKDLVDKYSLAYPSIRSRVQRGRIRLKQLLLECCAIKSDTRGNILDVRSKQACNRNGGADCKN